MKIENFVPICIARLKTNPKYFRKAAADNAYTKINNLDAEHTTQSVAEKRRGTMLNVSHCICDPARMPLVPCSSEFCVAKLVSQKCTRMDIFDEVVAVGFNTLVTTQSVAEKRAEKRQVLNPTHE